MGSTCKSATKLHSDLTVSENIHLQPYTSEQDFYDRIYPKYLALLDKARDFMVETDADPKKTIVLIRQVAVR
jgi:hypothetical protein